MSKICRTFAPEFEKLSIMKKNYNQPNVEVVEVLATSLMQAGSPGLNVSGDPIPSGGGGD